MTPAQASAPGAGGEPAAPGRYVMLAQIAAGGMASVHLARRLGEAGFARVVAVKVLHDHLVQDAEFVSAFLDEARLSARIRHPNVVDVYDVATVEGRLSIVMEHVEGAALSALLSEARRRGQPLPAG
ncbi:MAG: protein kinase, partial [Polyangiaceae bacterium]